MKPISVLLMVVQVVQVSAMELLLQFSKSVVPVQFGK